MTRRSGGIIAATLAMMLWPATAGAAERLKLAEARSGGFPDRAFVITLPDAQVLPEAKLTVSENGQPVDDLHVSLPGERSAVVLAIDTSKSMRRTIEDAMDAARAFADQRAPNQKLGVLFFSGTHTVALEPTTDSAKIEQTLAEAPELTPGTRLYDAGMEAVAMLDRANVPAGSVILLSDGADARSGATRHDLVTAAEAAQVRLFGVGIRSRSFDPVSLRALTEERGGSYVVASDSANLGGIYTELGERRANEYVLSYRSRQPLESDVAVAVSVSGIRDVATAAYTTPAFPIPPAVPEPPPSWWESNTAENALVAVVALLIALALWCVMRPSRPTLSGRLSAFTGEVVATDAEEEALHRARMVLTRADNRMARWKPWVEFKLDVDIAEIPWSPRRIAFSAVIAAAAVTGLLVFLDLYFFAALVFVGIPVIARSVIAYRAKKVRRRFEDQLPDNLQVMASALRAGQSFVGALAIMVKDAPQPSRREFRRVVQDEQLGISVETSLETVHARMRSEDVVYVGLIATLQRETGGNTAEVLDRVVETMRERGKLRRLVRTLTAQGRLGGWIVTALPVAMIVFLNLFQPNYMEPMLEKTVGWVILAVAALLVAFGAYCIRRIVDIKV